jgi:RNA recognition motif-containing protein
VEFEDDDTAQKSIALLNGKDLKGRPLRVNEAENRPPRPAGAPGAAGGYRPSFGGGAPGGGYRPSFGAGGGGGGAYSAPPPEFDLPMDDRGRPFKNKGSRRNIRRRKRGFD